jgi:hypothetical protein
LIRFQQQQEHQEPSSFISGNTTRTYVQQQQQQQQTLSQNTKEPYPRWDSHIPVHSIYDAIQVSLSGQLKYNQAHEVYIIHEQYTMYHSSVPHPSSLSSLDRSRIMETLALQVLEYIQHNPTMSKAEYPYLHSIIRYGGGFAYIVHYADSSLCANNSNNNNQSINPCILMIITMYCYYSMIDYRYQSLHYRHPLIVHIHFQYQRMK